MATGTDQTSATADWLVKYLYADGLNEEALTSSNALLAYVDRDKDFTSSKGKVIPVAASNTQAGYASNADAYAARAGGSGADFLVPMRRMFAFGTLSSDLVRLTEAGSDESQFTNILERDIDGATENFGQEINIALYGRNLGERAIAGVINGDVLELKNPEDAAYFEIGMRVGALDPATGTPRAGFTDIKGKDPIAGTLQGTAAWTFTEGDILIRWNTANSRLDGLAGWNPSTANLSTDFLGVDQTISRGTFAGVYVDVSAYAIRPGLLRAAAVAEGQLGQGFSKNAPFFMNPSDAMEIVASVEAVKVVETTTATKYNVGLETIEVLGCKIIKDRHCPVGRAHQVPKGAFTLGTAGDAPKIDDQDGKKLHYDRPTGQLQFILSFDGNSYSEAVNTLMHVRLPERAPL